MPSVSALLVLACAALASCSFNPLQHLAGIAPYFEPADPPLDPRPPQGCNVSRAAYLVRHAAIYANDFDYEQYIEPFVHKLGNSTVDWTRAGSLAFLASWKTPISDEEQEKLTKAGELEAFQLGVDVGQRYPDLQPPAMVWTSTAERTERSAQSFINGLPVTSNATDLVHVSESSEQGANSLVPHKSCPAYSSSAGSTQSSVRTPSATKALTSRKADQIGQQYMDNYTRPVIARFRALAPSFDFTAKDIVGMQELCGYETVIRGSSPFCSLDVFSPDEWLDFEYANDIQYHFNTGYGSSIAGELGFPWFNATVSLLVADPASSVQNVHVSFTHRELPPTVLVAMGLFNNTQLAGGDVNAAMPLTTPNFLRAWQSSRILPFLTNIALERMTCDSYGFSRGDYVRVLVNQNPQSIPSCADGPGHSCSKDAFAGYAAARADMFGGFSRKCGVQYTNSTDLLSVYTMAR